MNYEEKKVTYFRLPVLFGQFVRGESGKLSKVRQRNYYRWLWTFTLASSFSSVKSIVSWLHSSCIFIVLFQCSFWLSEDAGLHERWTFWTLKSVYIWIITSKKPQVQSNPVLWPKVIIFGALWWPNQWFLSKKGINMTWCRYNGLQYIQRSAF